MNHNKIGCESWRGGCGEQEEKKPVSGYGVTGHGVGHGVSLAEAQVTFGKGGRLGHV